MRQARPAYGCERACVHGGSTLKSKMDSCGVRTHALADWRLRASDPTSNADVILAALKRRPWACGVGMRLARGRSGRRCGHQRLHLFDNGAERVRRCQTLKHLEANGGQSH